MLSDGTLRGLKPEATAYKVADRDGMYVTVSPKGTITFRLDYRLNGRRETLTVGRYGAKDGISLLMARERCMEARRAIAEGQSPSQEKQREKRRMAEAKTFEQFTNRWLEEARMADSTKSMRKSIIDRDIMPAFRSRLLAEIGPEDLRNLCAKVKERGAPATAVHVRDIVKQVFSFAALHGDKAPNPADEVGPSSIATFVAKDRALSPSEIRVMHRVLDTTATLPTIRLALRLVLLTLVRKSELIEATWNEIDFENAVWTIPKSRMKAGKPHNVYLSQQALDIMVALRTCAGGSRFLLPSRYDADRCMSKATLNRVTQVVVEKAKESRLPLESFTVHDLRRTGSTILNELGFNSDWIEKCLAHEDGRSSRGVYNKAEYGEQRRHMLQEWADMIDAWVAGAVGNSMFADLTSVAGSLYKFGTGRGLPGEIRPRRIAIHADEFIPLLNKAGGAGFQVTAYTQTWSDVEARIGSTAKAGQIAGNFNTLIMLRVKEVATAELLTDQLPEVHVVSTIVSSSVSDTNDPGEFTDFASRNEDRIAPESVRMLEPTDLVQLPKGQAFALIHGGQLHKIRMPLPSAEHDPLMPEGLKAIGQALRNRLDGPWNRSQEDQGQAAEVEARRGE